MKFETNSNFEGSNEPLIENYTLDNQWASEEEILNSNNVEDIVEYAKEARSQSAIDKVRELLEFSRKTGEEVVQNFLNSFNECKEEGLVYLDFEKTKSGKYAMNLLDKMPEPFRGQAIKKLEDYKEDLKSNTELFEVQKENPEAIWKKLFGINYHNSSEISEKLKSLLFKRAGSTFKDYYKKKELRAEQDPFAINLFVGDSQSFNNAIDAISENDIEEANNKIGGFSTKLDGTSINVLNVSNHHDINANQILKKNIIHESEHALHRNANPFDKKTLVPKSLMEDLGFEENVIFLNQCMRFDFQEELKRAKDETFAYLKGGFAKGGVKKLLKDKSPNSLYDYNKKTREVNNLVIDNNKYLSKTEKEKLRDGINFFQTEYEKVLENMFEIIYDGEKSVEFLRNVPINELWKYSKGKYSRTDFLVKEFKV